MFSGKNTYAALPERFFSRVNPTHVPEPKLIALNHDVADLLGFDVAFLQSEIGVQSLVGNVIPQGAEPIAQAYAGHQFAHWVPQLGDGRAILMGEVIAKDSQRYDMQWKGSGRTPFSRGGDGKAALGPAMREYLVSEAMYALGVPTTRALALLSTGESVLRERSLPGAIFVRVAASHIRVGTFQYFYARNDVDALKILADYVIQRHYPHALTEKNPPYALLENVIAAQAKLIAHWMSIGFIHGVMNTDNCAVSGETIDYGPCAFMDEFHPQCVFSSIDRNARYSWGNQPSIGLWNLSRFAETLLPLLADTMEQAQVLAEAALEKYTAIFEQEFFMRFKNKLGISNSVADDVARVFIEKTFKLLTEQQIDFTLFFRGLTYDSEKFSETFAEQADCLDWYDEWRNLFSAEKISVMKMANPVFIPRNHLIERAIQAAYEDDFSLFHRLNAAWRFSYEIQANNADLEAAPLPHEKVHNTFCGT